MPADEAPADDDEQVRQSYNFAPGYHGLIYRAATSDRGGSNDADETEPSPSKKQKTSHSVDGLATTETKYKLQAAKWGLIPFWTKRSPDYGSMMRTINCRDDSLIENKGMWNTMKQRKRCIVVAEGFYEWLKKNGGKEKVPHFVKRKDGGLMCFAGLWDCVTYEDMKEGEKLYTYTVITTDSNAQLKFLHDRMPVILEPASAEMAAWLDPKRVGWDKELQGMLKPFKGELECYPVDKAVGKVGNNSPSFVVPVDSKENKKNIANFFANQTQQKSSPIKSQQTEPEHRETATKVEDPESNAPLPKPSGTSDAALSQATKDDTAELADYDLIAAADEGVEKGIKRELDEVEDGDSLAAEQAALSPPQKKAKTTPVKASPRKDVRSATTNVGVVGKSPAKGKGERKITAFFGGK